MHPAYRKSDAKNAINLLYENVFIYCILDVMMSRVSNKIEKIPIISQIIVKFALIW